MTEYEKVFCRIKSRSVKGLMIHNDLFEYFTYLGLQGFACEQRCRYIDESIEYVYMEEWYINHYGTFIPETDFVIEKIIPDSLRSHGREMLSNDEVLTDVFNALTDWTSWEFDNKVGLEEDYCLLVASGDICGAKFILDRIENAGKEYVLSNQRKMEVSRCTLDGLYSINEALMLKYGRSDS